jgi:hypothetical protein
MILVRRWGFKQDQLLSTPYNNPAGVIARATLRGGSNAFSLDKILIVVVGAICFWAIDKFVRDGRLANLLKILIVLICVAAVLQRLLPALGVNLF